jgi:hypothetical protein
MIWAGGRLVLLSEEETDPESPVRFWHQMEPEIDPELPFSTWVIIIILLLFIVGLFGLVWWTGGAILGA